MADKNKKVSSKTTEYIYAVGRRKTATARVRLYLKKGDLLVNDKAAGQYFPSKIAMDIYMKPLQLTNMVDKFSFSAKVAGSGKQAQVEAVAHGLARALANHDPEDFRPVLKQHGLLTRDPRMKESRKVGMGGKARRKKQSPKR
jgi:small subunit ribosomal protein S9